MPTQALLLADDPNLQPWLNERLGTLLGIVPADSSGPDSLADEVAQTPDIAVVFVQFDDHNAMDRAQVVERLATRHPAIPVVAIGSREASAAVLAAMRAGARDFLVVGRDDSNLPDLIERVLRKAPRSAGNRAGAGVILAVVSARADAGVPFLATHLALALQQRGADTRILLMDLSLPGGAVLVFLDTDQGYGALDALKDVDRCDQTLIDTAFTRHREGLYLLSLPEDCVAPPAIDDDDFGRLLESFAGFFDYVVVAADNGIGVAPLASLIGRARKSLLVSDQSVLRSRQNKQLLHALRQYDCPLDNMGLVIDALQPKVGMEPERLAALLELPFTAGLTGRAQTRAEAMNAGEPLCEYAPKDGYWRDVLALTEQIGGEAPAPAARRGLFKRILGP